MDISKLFLLINTTLEEQLWTSAGTFAHALKTKIAKASLGKEEYRVPLTPAEARIHQLSDRVYQSTAEKERCERALDILTRHPEFHEFLEVLRSGLV